MGGISYFDLDLKIEKDGQRYRALVLNSPAGQATQVFDLPFSDLEVENFLLRLGRPRRGVRRADSPEVLAVKKFGGDLFAATFREEVLARLRASMGEAARQNAGLRIRMHLTEVPELADLPWEFLYDQTMNRFLVLSDETPLVRYLDLPEGVRPHALEPPLRVLVMISSPSDFPTLEVEKEWETLRTALAELEKRGLVLLKRVDQATPTALRRLLRQEEFHVLHFIGHGGFDQESQDGVLILEDEAKRGRRMSGADLGMVLHDHRPMRLAVLIACEGARCSRSDPFGGTAQSLVQQGIPAVIAMQFEITDQAAITFAQEFYAALADNYPVDAALAEARKAICDGGFVPEWGTPVLYLRERDGRLFDVKRASAEQQSEARAGALLQEAEKAEAQADWTNAAAKLEEILAMRPEHAAAKAKLEQVHKAERAEKHYQQGSAAAKAGRWSEALVSFERCRGIAGDFKDVAARIAEAQAGLQREKAAPAPPPPRQEDVARPVAALIPPPQPVAAPMPLRMATAPVKGSGNKWLWLGAGGALMFVVLLVIGLAMRPSEPAQQPGPVTPSQAGVAPGQSQPSNNNSQSNRTQSGDSQLAGSQPDNSARQSRAAAPAGGFKESSGTSVPPAPGAQEPQIPIEEQILERAVNGLGGQAALLRLTSRIATGTFAMQPGNLSGQFSLAQRAPNKSATEFAFGNGAFIRQGFDGAVAWTSNPKDGVRQLYGAEFAEMARDADFYGDLHLREQYPAIKYVGEQNVGGRVADVLKLSPASGNPRTVYLDRDSGLNVRTDMLQVTPDGMAEVQTYSEDFRDVDGVRLPFRVRQVSAQFTMVIQIYQMRHNMPLNDSLFAKPYGP